MYKVGNGLLRRMYNTSGGTYGAQNESAVYRDLVQRELSELEDVSKLWKTYSYADSPFCSGKGFGDYQDWVYNEFDAKIFIRHDHADDFKPFKIGKWGLCISCGNIADRRIYCNKCE